MQDLVTFLTSLKGQMTAPAAVTAVRDHQVVTPRLISANVMGAMLAQRLYAYIFDLSEDKTSVHRSPCLVFIHRLQGDGSFNFCQGDPIGEGSVAMLNAIISDQDTPTDIATELAALRNEVVARSTVVTKPYKNVTLHDVLVAWGECSVKPVNSVNGYLLVSLIHAVEHHSARVFGTNPRTNQPQILGRIWLSDVGAYEFKIPTHYLQHTDFRIDDAYGAIA